MDDLPGHGAGGGHRRTGKVNFTFRMPHPADKVPVGGGDGALTRRQDPHMPPQAGAAGGRGDSRARFNKDIHQTFPDRLEINPLGAGEIIVLTKGATFFPRRTWAAIRRSSRRPLVHDPITD